MSLLDRLRRRLQPPSPPSVPSPAPLVRSVPTEVPGSRPPAPLPPLPEGATWLGELVSPGDLATLLAAIHTAPAPRLVYHWASWDPTSTAGLGKIQALYERSLSCLGVAWDEFIDPPGGRIQLMATRPAKWAGGVQVAAWVREKGLSWPTVVFSEAPERLFEGLGLGVRFVPQVALYGAAGEVLVYHEGPLDGAGWEAFVEVVEELVGRP